MKRRGGGGGRVEEKRRRKCRSRKCRSRKSRTHALSLSHNVQKLSLLKRPTVRLELLLIQ